MSAANTGGAEGVSEPGSVLLLLCADGLLFLDYQKRAERDDGGSHELDRQVACLTKKHYGDKHGEHSAHLVDGYNLVDVSDAERLKVTDPRGTGGESPRG